MYSINNQKKGARTMRATFIRRRIVAAIAVSIMSWGVVNTGQAIVDFLNEPTFACLEGEDKLSEEHRTLYSIAGKWCDGNLTDASRHIMQINNIEGRDLGSLRLGQTIIIKKGK